MKSTRTTLGKAVFGTEAAAFCLLLALLLCPQGGSGGSAPIILVSIVFILFFLFTPIVWACSTTWTVVLLPLLSLLALFLAVQAEPVSAKSSLPVCVWLILDAVYLTTLTLTYYSLADRIKPVHIVVVMWSAILILSLTALAKYFKIF